MVEETYQPGTADAPPSNYHPPVLYDNFIEHRDVRVPMRDGVELCVDIYLPDAKGKKVPALLAIAPHNKEFQTPEIANACPPQPAWAALWTGPAEGGDTVYLTSRGYAHIIGNYRNCGKSGDGGDDKWDLYDLIEWIAAQPWCDGNVGMIGISAFGGAQFKAAALQPPHLKAIFPYDPMGAYGEWTFRDFYPGGLVHTMIYLLDPGNVAHFTKGCPGPLPEEKERQWQEAVNNPDYRMYPSVYNIAVMKGQNQPLFYSIITNPYETKELAETSEETFGKIKIPAYTGSGWYGYTYKAHIQGSQHWYERIDVPKKMLLTGPAHLERPFRCFHEEILKWYDYWLKGIDTGIMNEPSVKYWLMGANEWRYGDNWPLPETKWTKLYLDSWERLRFNPFIPGSRDGYDEPDSFVQMPPTHTNKIQKLRYQTEPLAEDMEITGPISLTLYAEIDQADTNWIVILKDIGPDVSVRTAREGEWDIPDNLHERELTRGWLKASHRALNPEKSKPWRPWHLLTREAQKPVTPGEIVEYQIEIISTANLFKKGHRICIDITSLDLPQGTAGLSSIEYIAPHICSSKTTLHKVYRNGKYPSHLLLPVIPPKS